MHHSREFSCFNLFYQEKECLHILFVFINKVSGGSGGVENKQKLIEKLKSCDNVTILGAFCYTELDLGLPLVIKQRDLPSHGGDKYFIGYANDMTDTHAAASAAVIKIVHLMLQLIL